MTSTTLSVKLEDDVLRKFYRSFHKHGPGNWTKMAKDTKMSVEQCEMLHKLHMSFLSLPASPALETAFLALVNDHYNSTQSQVKDEAPEDDVPRSGRASRREAEDPEAVVTASTSQKPRRTPKPTPQRLAAEEEAQARRLARVNQGTPKSARAKMAAKAPPSPPGGEWTSSQRKRSRKLFEDSGEADGSRYRSPIIDRWRGRHNTDVDEGVDALLSLASGAHASSALDERPSTADVAAEGTLADEEAEPHDMELIQATPKRARGGRAGRSTPTPTGTPVKGAARGSADALAGSGAAGLRSPKSARGGLAAAGNTPVRSGTGNIGRPKKEPRGSPTSSVERRGEGVAVLQPGAEASDGGAAAGARPGSDGGADAASGEAAKDGVDAATEDCTGAGGASCPLSALGRPVRKRKPTAIALAAAAAAGEEDMIGGRGARGVVAAIASAVAATGATVSEAVPTTSMPEAAAAGGPVAVAAAVLGDANGSSQAAELLSNTAALLATVPPVRTRASARIASGGPGSRRAAAGERASPAMAEAGGACTEANDEGGLQPGQGTVAGAEAGEEEGEARVKAEADVDGLPGPGTSGEPAAPADVPAPASGRGRGRGGAGQAHAHGSGAGARSGAGRGGAHAPPGRKRRRKSRPERLPPLFESLKISPAQTGTGPGIAGDATAAPAPPAAAAAAPDDSALGDTADAAAAAAAGPLGAVGTSAEAAIVELPRTSIPTAELALRHCLGPRVRRWCMYEFFYSALDRPWFLRNELLEFCLHMQLPTTKLTRFEWAVLRGALGRPRRLSLAFLRDERLRLEGYRENARLKYEEVALGMEVPPELPRQLRVGQEVTARHPVSRQLHDGVILTVKGNKYRVQFHRGDLMTEVVRDTEVMPVDPHECMPLHQPIVPYLLNGRQYDAVRLANVRGLPPGVALQSLAMGYRPVGTWATGLDNQMMRDQDAALLLEVQRALELKEGLVAQLTQLNNEAASGLHSDEAGGGCTENFQLQYTRVVLQLKETNASLEAAMARLQSRSQQVVAANMPLGSMLGLQPPYHPHQQQQQPGSQLLNPQIQQAGASAGAQLAADLMSGARGGAATAGLTVGPPGQQPQLQSLALQGPVQTPPVHGLQAPGTGPAPSPPPAPAPSAVPGLQQQQSQARGVVGKGVAPFSPGAPLVVAPPRPSAMVSVAQVQTTQFPFATGTAPGLPSHHATFLLPAPSPEQLVDHAFAEARSVVDTCRGKYADGLSGPGPGLLLQPAGVQQGQVPVIAPIIAMQMQPAGGGPVPLILPPGAVLPPQVALPQAACVDAAAHGQQQDARPVAGPASALATASGEAGADGRAPFVLPDGSAAANGHPAAVGVSGLQSELAAAVRHIKTEPGVDMEGPTVVSIGPHPATAALLEPAVQQTEEEVAEMWLRNVIVGCVGVLFTIQKCTAGGVSAGTVAEALDLAVKQLQIKTDGENDGLYKDIAQSVEGLKGHLTKAIA